MQKEKDIYPLNDVNCAIYDTSGSFDPQLPMGREQVGTASYVEGETVPPGVLYLEDGGLYLSFQAKEASKAEVILHNKKYELNRHDNGLWDTVLYVDNKGFCPLTFLIDGVEVLNPLAPIGFGASRPINYVDIPNRDETFYLYKDVPHGSVTQDYYFSAVTGCVKSCLVYTPPEYMKETKKNYPVLYLQHGHGENEQCWIHQGKANFIIDNMIAEGKARPCIVVMNNGMVQKSDGKYRVLETEKIENLLLEDCIPYIEKHYRVKTGKWNRAMAGLSMGSMQTSVVTLKHPDMFGYAGIFSGFVTPLNDKTKDDYLKALDDKEKFQNNYKIFFRAIGDSDLVALDRFNSDSKLLEEKGLSPEQCAIHVEKFYHGEHEWNVWRECLRDFLGYLF